MKTDKLFAIRILRLFCPPHLLEEIEGDLLQKFERDLQVTDPSKVSVTSRLRRAKRRLLWNVISYFRPGIMLRNKFLIELNVGYMLQNYFKIAFRHLMRSKVFSMINIAGLAIGMVAFFLIVQYVSYEMSYDQFHENKNEIYRLTYSKYENGELKNTSAKQYPGIRWILKEHFSDLNGFTSFDQVFPTIGLPFSYKNKMFFETGGLVYADQSFFKVFPSLLVKGSITDALKDSTRIVLSEKIAKKIFADEDPLGKTLFGNEESIPYTVSGVFRDLPENSHLQASFIVGPGKSQQCNKNCWEHPELYTYVLLSEKNNPNKISERLIHFFEKLSTETPEMKGVKIGLQPVTDIHLNSNFHDEIKPSGNLMLIYILIAVGLVIIVIAWINYINIEIARFAHRVREVGIRCIIGSSKKDLALQFLVQYFCMSVFSILMALILMWFTLPQFSFITGLPINGFDWYNKNVWLFAAVIFVIGSITTGIYPAIFLAKINPIKAVKGVTGANRGSLLRKSLMVIQFTASLSLIGFLSTTLKQLDLMQLTNKKIDIEKVVVVRNPAVYIDQSMQEKNKEYKLFEDKVLAGSAIKSFSSSSAIPGREIEFTIVNNLKRNQGDAYSDTRYKLLFIDQNYIPLYQLKLKAGVNYTSTDKDSGKMSQIILNEGAVTALGFKSAEEALNQPVYMNIWDWVDPHFKIIGVVEDYHHEAVKKAISPCIFWFNQQSFQAAYYSIKLNASVNPQAALTYIEKSWKEIFPDRPFDYFFLDNYYDQQFKSERHFGRIFGAFAGIAVFLACLGILGLTLFEANSRLKEISIRKVLGASVANLMLLLSKKYFRLIVIATLIASPLIYFAANSWLQTYPVRIEISPLFFVLPVAALLVIVGLASGFQTFKAANANPVDHLKNE